MESLSPNIFVTDINKTIEFYTILGFDVAMSVPEAGPDYVWAMMVKGKVTMMFQTMESLADGLPEIKRTDGGSLLLYFNVSGIHSFFEDIKDKVTVLKGLEKPFMGLPNFLYWITTTTF